MLAIIPKYKQTYHSSARIKADEQTMTTEVMTKISGIQVKENGEPAVMTYGEFELEPPAAGQARVKIHAAGVNFIDVYQRRGTYPVNLPWVPGLEGAGVVEEVGAGVSSVRVGDRVAFNGIPGAYAQAINAPADRLISLPEELSFEEGAAFPLQGMTAHYLLHEFYRLRPGQTVLIHAAAGGMGLLLVQWAKHLGARVIGTVSGAAKAEQAKLAGADDVIIYTEKDFVEEAKLMTDGKGPEFIIDGVGKDTFAKNLQAVASRGHVVIYGAASGLAEPIMPNALQGRAVTVSGGSLFVFVESRDELNMRSRAVIAGIKEGWLKLSINHVFPLSEAAKAHELLENRLTTGKVILTCQ